MNIKWTAKKSLTLTRILTLVTLVLAGAALFCIPVMTEWYDAVSGHEPIRMMLTVCLYLSAFLGIAALLGLLKMLDNIAQQQVFVEQNAFCLRLIAWCCFAVTAIWIVLALRRPLALFVAFIAAFAGLVVRVVKNLLEMGTTLREENDYTI
jgi:hypothetical protein